MTERTGASWFVYALGTLCAGAIAAAILVVGPASGSQTNVTRTATVAQGVVQSTVSGSGNVQAVSQLNLGFKTGGTVTRIYVSQGQHVVQGQLLATLDPQSAEVTLEQAKATRQSAAANLAREEETDGESSSGQGASAAESSQPQQSSQPKSKSGSPSSTSTLSTATREANLASARAAVKSDALTVQSDEQAVQNTMLYAPESGTIVSLSGQVGEVVSASGTTRASSATGSSGGSGSGAGAGGSGAAASSGRSGTGASSASSGAGSSGSSSSTFAVLSDLSSMQLVVALSESEIDEVGDGQIATVTVEALGTVKLAAHVSEVALLSTSSSGAVSYDVTFQLDQLTAGLRLGMSATAEVVVKQAEGINVPTSAISADSVTVERGGKQVRQRVVTGLKGNTSTIILSGLKAGETVVLPTVTSTGGSAASLTSRLAGRLGALSGAGGLGGGGLGGGGGGPALFRGGG